MRIKHDNNARINATVAADELGIKPSRSGWKIRAEQAERLARLLEMEDRPSTHKAKRGKQAVAGRVRVERVEVEVEEELVDFDERPTHWGVVCHSANGEWYVTTAAMLEDRIDLNTVAVRHYTDRVIGVMGFWEKRDLRFAAVGRAHRDWAATDDRLILGWSLDKEYYFYRK
jgi:hypothetical protein